MREIKFRAWDERYKRMNDFSSHKTGLLYSFGSFEMSSGWDSYDNPTFDENVMEHIEIMQCTGLKDKNGVEIYEGDIVKVKSRLDCVIGQVVYKDTSFGFNVPVSNEFEERFRGLNTGWYGTEVIGNIHENPELLEQAE